MRTSRIAGTVAGGIALAAAVAVGGASAASAPRAAADPVTVHVINGTEWDNEDIALSTGEAVTWDFGTASPHNVASDNDVPADPAWAPFVEPGEFVPAPTNATYSYTFNQPGDYVFICEFHPETMRGTIHVTGDPIETPTPSPTATATPSPTPPAATPTPTPIPQPSNPHTTPPPSAHTDTVKPRVTRVKLKSLRHGARVRFKLSENATVSLSFRKRSGKHKRLATVRRQVRKGTRTITVHSRKLKKGRYTVELRARDPFGNRSALVRKRLTVRR
jgi:plastocyanin